MRIPSALRPSRCEVGAVCDAVLGAVRVRCDVGAVRGAVRGAVHSPEPTTVCLLSRWWHDLKAIQRPVLRQHPS